MSTPPPIPTQPNLGVQLARASWIAPIVGVGLNVLSNTQPNSTRGAKLVIGLTSFGIYFLGLIFGIVALAMMRKYGRARILVPAITGVTINALLVLAFVLVMVIALQNR